MLLMKPNDFNESNGMKMRAGLIVLILLISNVIYSQGFDKTKMDSLFALIEHADKGMGSVSLFKDGKEIFSRGYGYADVENKIKPDKNTKYRIGSISKTFTATLVMKLVEEGKLSLNDKLSVFYPQVKNSEKISIEDLLRHQSGIHNITDATDYDSWNTSHFSKEQLLDKIVSGGNDFLPGESFAYSNSNYILLTFILEDVSKELYSSLLKKYIVKPCNLKNTGLGTKIEPSKNEAYSYIKTDTWKKQSETDLSIPLGAGFLTSTPHDLNVFLNALFDCRIVKKESLDQMVQINNNFGLGLIQVPFYELKGYGHTGGIDGFVSNAFYFPSEKVSVAVTSNGISYPMNDIVTGVLSIYFGKEFVFPEFKKAQSLTSEELDKYVGIYSTVAFPLKITISKTGSTLMGQATGQPSFPLEYAGEDTFRFDSAKLKLIFNPQKKTMILEQFGQKFEMTQE